MRLQFDIMAKRPQRHKQESDWFLETLRIEFTELNQDDFIAQCGFARATYQRWAAKKLALSEVKLTAEQIVAVCRICRLSLKGFFQRSGIDVGGIPDDSPLLNYVNGEVN